MYERYHHDVVGVNSRLDSIQAAVLMLSFLYWMNITKQDKMQLENIQQHLKVIKILLLLR
jgi:dTDP-4-amino-4,6-dideoxygalactose transaminase